MQASFHRSERCIEYEVAQRAYPQALTLDPGLEPATIWLALCLSALGRFSEAGEALSKAYELGNRSLDVLRVMGTLPPGRDTHHGSTLYPSRI
jgi:tetratricopeptide (TPR) repeat protein